MPEAPKPDADKNRKSRPFGSFLLFIFFLIVILAYFGRETINRTEILSQDEYLWNLYSGRIESQEFKGNSQGSNLIEGYLRRGEDQGRPPIRFKVTYADVEQNETLYRELKAIRDLRPIDARSLRSAIEGGWYEPFKARSLTGYVDREEPVAGVPEPAENAAVEVKAPKRLVRERQGKLLVGVVAQSRKAWEETTGRPYDLGGNGAEFWLPEQSGDVWFEVSMDRDADLGGLLATLTGEGASIERHTFDLTPGKGSRWSDATNMLLEFLVIYGPWILIFVVFMIFMRQIRSQGGAGGVMSFGRSRAQLYTKENRTNITFDDVAGATEAKDEVREIVEFLRNPGRFTRIGGRIPRGVLLVGPPGCGKTLLAKAIAGEAEVPFFSISGSDFVEMFVGVGASRVRDLFKQARDNSPCIIFLDEIDAVGRRRGSGMGGGHDEREQTLNAILVEMDGFGTDEGIIVIAATNRPDVLDPALLRPGRFDREVVIDLPDFEGREAILNVHLKRVKSEDVDVQTLAKSTAGYSGADLAAIVNEAAIMAVLAKRDAITQADLEEARDKVRFGRQKRSRRVEEEDRKITAYHEAGHAVVASVIPETDRPHKVTIVPRGRALGATMVLPDKESYHMQKRRLMGQLAVLFGGRVAEAEFCGDISAGASDDIKRATDLARAMVAELGMSEKIGPINYGERQGSEFLGTELMRGKLHSEETAREIDREVHQLLKSAYERAETIVREHRSHIEELSQALLDLETVSGEEVRRILTGTNARSLRPRPSGGPDGSAAPVHGPQPKTGSSDGRSGKELGGDLPGNAGLSPA